MEKNEITIEEVHDLVDNIARDPRVKIEDIFDNVKNTTSYNWKEMIHKICIPALVYISSLIGTIFITNDSWKRLMLLLFIIAFLIILCIIKKQKWIFSIVSIILIYVSYGENVSINTIVEIIKKIIDLI